MVVSGRVGNAAGLFFRDLYVDAAPIRALTCAPQPHHDAADRTGRDEERRASHEEFACPATSESAGSFTQPSFLRSAANS